MELQQLVYCCESACSFSLSNKSIFNGRNAFKHLKVFSFCHVFDTRYDDNVDNPPIHLLTSSPPHLSAISPLSPYSVCLSGQLAGPTPRTSTKFWLSSCIELRDLVRFRAFVNLLHGTEDEAQQNKASSYRLLMATGGDHILLATSRQPPTPSTFFKYYLATMRRYKARYHRYFYDFYCSYYHPFL